jgi:hypothetical protein
MFDPIDRDVLQEHLAAVERRIARSEKIIARQRAEIADLERSGRETKTARELLAQFEQLLELQIADRDRLLNKRRLRWPLRNQAIRLLLHSAVASRADHCLCRQGE